MGLRVERKREYDSFKSLMRAQDTSSDHGFIVQKEKEYVNAKRAADALAKELGACNALPSVQEQWPVYVPSQFADFREQKFVVIHIPSRRHGAIPGHVLCEAMNPVLDRCIRKFNKEQHSYREETVMAHANERYSGIGSRVTDLWKGEIIRGLIYVDYQPWRKTKGFKWSIKLYDWYSDEFDNGDIDGRAQRLSRNQHWSH